jgi:hypothetical protein
LLDGYRGRQSLNFIEIGFLQLIQKLPGISGQRLHVFPLAFSEDGVESQGAFAATGQAGDDDDLVARDIDVDALEIVLAGASNADEFRTHGRFIRLEYKQDRRRYSRHHGNGALYA